MFIFLKFIFYISLFFLIIVSIYPGSLLGFFLYDDFSQQPNLIKNPFGTTINHFIYYIYVSFLGLSLYKDKTKIFYKLLFLSISLELIHFILPYRSFQIPDLAANILGVLVAYSIIKIYLFLIKL